jgi:hypothetical protein
LDISYVHWHLPGNFVNNFYYPDGCPSCSLVYANDPNFLTNWTTTCWYVRDLKNSVCSVGTRLHMSNGQQVNIAAAGQFSVYRPAVTFPAHAIPAMIPMLTNNWLQLGNARSRGGDDVGTMQFDAAVTSKAPFVGAVNWTQLIRRSLPANPSDTGGQYNLNASPYGSDVFIGYENEISFYDSPGLSSWTGFWTLKDDYQTYLQFRPADGIAVTLGVVSWGWSAKEYNWALTDSSTTPPSFQDSDAFPQWTK